MFFALFTPFFFSFFKTKFFRDSWGVNTALSKILRIFCEKLRRNKLPKLTTFSNFFQLPHSALVQGTVQQSAHNTLVHYTRIPFYDTCSTLWHSLLQCIVFNVELIFDWYWWVPKLPFQGGKEGFYILQRIRLTRSPNTSLFAEPPMNGALKAYLQLCLISNQLHLIST